jgi:hypothetical protein
MGHLEELLPAFIIPVSIDILVHTFAHTFMFGT